MQLDFEAFDRRIADGTLARGEWTGTLADGRETACALAALWPQCGEKKTYKACPAKALDPRFAYLVPWLDDADLLSDVDIWLDRMRRLSVALRRVVAMTPAELDTLDRRIKVRCVEEALSHVTTDDWGVRAVCEGVIVALRGDGNLGSARVAARAAARAADTDAGAAAGAAARAAEAAARAAEAASWAGDADAGAAAWVARAAAWAADAAAGAAARSARVASERRLADAIIEEMMR